MFLATETANGCQKNKGGERSCSAGPAAEAPAAKRMDGELELGQGLALAEQASCP